MNNARISGALSPLLSTLATEDMHIGFDMQYFDIVCLANDGCSMKEQKFECLKVSATLHREENETTRYLCALVDCYNFMCIHSAL